MKTKLLCFVVLVILSTSLVQAQMPARFDRSKHHEPEQNFRPGPGERINKFLMLTEEQRKAIKQIRLESAKELKPFKDELREINARHQTLITATMPDLKTINQSIEKIGAVKVKIAQVKAKNQQEFRALLTGEQLLKLDNQKERIKDLPLNLRHRGKRRT